MSYETAVSACNSCFSRHGISEKQTTLPGSARYEALMAIEVNTAEAMDARISCHSCVYSSPRIAELLGKPKTA
jgi:hypothetical protein